MRKMKSLVFAVVFAPLFTSPASGQACLGLPSFESSLVHVNLSGEFPDGATGYAMGVGAGRPDALFATIGGGRVSYDGLEEKSSFGFLEFGYQYPLGRFEFCPIMGGYLGIGPDDPSISLEVTSRAASGGGALGIPLELGALEVIPNLAIRYEYFSQKVVEEGFGSATYTFDYTTLDLALALLFDGRFGIQPIAHIPVAGDDSEVSYGLFASVALGWP